jgi:hypothetical protein
MRLSTDENVRNRVLWLESLREQPQKDPSLLDYFVSLKAFCGLSIPGQFHKISYNTLKCAAKQGIRNLRSMPTTDHWEYLKSLFNEVKCLMISTPNRSEKPPLPPSDEILRQTLLDAHICSMAYLEIYKFLDNLIKISPELPVQTNKLITKQLAQCQAKFRTIISHSSTYNQQGVQLKIVEGEQSK